ncbi:putative TetR family transcriptional regulator [Nocardia brasiliensis NBRC 14402]|uniref:TetR/AcrR family transcriptional regulator n=1 Tax=Nocardia brasiliensis TaxID=37326 RepID=UPI0002D2BC45|nr:TetR/AcrR family transcriptional regulator [Nocardia brasiliensis]ASF06975.1 TetR/AcrR family transcriptional regulator [Nocardia brasiliensis]GAJ84406.1 putative TetR family transcriptional regulator [Nocardia brasiliensis NBRC 14402]SUB47793.1 DNA-binding transcriptional regulator EnvR [Nocardia brasiliensis]
MADDNRLQRTYRSPVREDAARRTRDIVVRAAMQVFAERGYAGATIDQIANCAGVSRPTVFAAGNKAQLFALARQYVDNDGDGAEADSTMTQILEIDDPRRLLERFATHTAAIMRRARPLQGVLEQAAGTDPELAELLKSTQQRLLETAGSVVAAVAATRSLRRGISRRAAIDVLWLQLQYTNYQRLVDERGWSHREFERWLATAMIATLLEPSHE